MISAGKIQYSTPGQAGGVQRFARSEFASRLTNLLRSLIQGPHGLHPIYYVACVPPKEESRQAEGRVQEGWGRTKDTVRDVAHDMTHDDDLDDD